MKRKSRILIPILVLLVSTNILSAQNQENRFVVSASLSSSAMGALFKVADAASTKFSTYSHQAVQGSFDYCIYKNWLSVGLIASYQKMGIVIPNHGVVIGADTIKSNIGVDLTRFNIGGRILVHYGNKRHVDMYSGLRLGYQRNALYTDSDGILYDILSEYKELSHVLKYLGIGPDMIWNPIVQNAFGVQVILFGIRTYEWKNVGLTAEIAVGRPNFLSYGIVYRF